MIGVTGHTGHLGRELMRLLPEAIPLGRDLPDAPLTAIIHTACPNWRNDDAVDDFNTYNQRLARYITRNQVHTIVNVGSWWQYAVGTCQTLPYTLQKHRQARLLEHTDAAVKHVIPYSIYGNEARPGRGFIPQLVEAIQGKRTLAGLSTQRRDFIHVEAVARACIAALTAPPGTYRASTGLLTTPQALAHIYGVTAPPYEEHPTAQPRYPHSRMPNWTPGIDVLTHLKQVIRSGADAHPTATEHMGSGTR